MSEKDSDDRESRVDPLKSIALLLRKRGIHKRKITIYLKKLEQLEEEKRLSPSFCKTQMKEIDIEVSRVKECDDEINEIMEQHDLSSCNEEFYIEEFDNQAESNLEVGLELDSYIISKQDTSNEPSLERLT